MGLIYEMIVMIPTIIIWFLTVRLSAAGAAFTFLIPLVLSVLILVFSALLGWLVALVGSRLKHKNVIVVTLSLIFFAVYYYFCGHIYLIAHNIIANPKAVGNQIRGIFYPMYHMGMAAEGNVLSMLIFTAIVSILFAVVFWALSKNFLKVVTTNRGEAKAQYKERSIKARPISQALLQKELRRFLGSSLYMLNCGLGIVIMLVSAVSLIWKHAMVQEMLYEIFPENQDIVFLIAACTVCLLSAMNDITAPSVSLEGKNLWLVQVFPVSGRQVLMAKLKLHLILTMIPAAVLIIAVEWVLKPTIGFSVMIPVVVAVFILVMAEFGLCLNLKMPNLHWTSEVVPIKQSIGALICLFGGWGLVVALLFVYFLLAAVLSSLAYLVCVSSLLFAVAALLLYWLFHRGAKIFENL